MRIATERKNKRGCFIFDTETGIRYSLSIQNPKSDYDYIVILDIESAHNSGTEYTGGVRYVNCEAVSFWNRMRGFVGTTAEEDLIARVLRMADEALEASKVTVDKTVHPINVFNLTHPATSGEEVQS